MKQSLAKITKNLAVAILVSGLVATSANALSIIVSTPEQASAPVEPDYKACNKIGLIDIFPIIGAIKNGVCAYDGFTNPNTKVESPWENVIEATLNALGTSKISSSD